MMALSMLNLNLDIHKHKRNVNYLTSQLFLLPVPIGTKPY